MDAPVTVPIEFEAYRRTFVHAIHKTLQESTPGSLDEAAFPAYSHPNPVINWIYWQRLRTVMHEVAKGKKISKAIDFGCGSGVLLPFLAHYADTVTGMDLEVGPWHKMQHYIDFPKNVGVVDLNKKSLNSFEAGSYDLITSLNVMEHIKDPAPIIEEFFILLKEGGKLIVSLPKENKVYCLARKLAGKEFTGEYHATTYKQIEEVFRTYGELHYLLRGSIFQHVYRIFSVTKA